MYQCFPGFLPFQKIEKYFNILKKISVF